jgi:hypothetical protein
MDFNPISHYNPIIVTPNQNTRYAADGGGGLVVTCELRGPREKKKKRQTKKTDADGRG